jgi:methylated-DNA-protein-cysteine methyltransferase-like protein
VIAAIRKIPRGKVATYGQIAKLAGKPRAARAVAWLLHSSSRTRGLPWQRVVSARGAIAFPWGTPAHLEQKRRLEAERVAVGPRGEIDLERYGWERIGRKTRKNKG